MKITITGATGFIGSHLTERLVREGHDVTVIVRKASGRAGRDGCLSLIRKLKARIVYGDLLDKDSLAGAVSRGCTVFHLAAIARPMAIPRDVYFEVNEKGTRNLLEVCRDKGVRKVVHMSSISAVGPSRDGKPVNEETPCAPIDIYGESKLAAEKVADGFVKGGMDIVMLRPPMVFGPRDMEMLRLFRSISRGIFPVMTGEGSRTEFLYVENLVDACLLAQKKGKSGRRYHVSNERSYRMKEIVEAIRSEEGVRLLPLRLPGFALKVLGGMVECAAKVGGFHPPFKHDTVDWMTKRFWYSDISRAKKELGYRPAIGLREGVRRTVSYYRGEGLISPPGDA